MTFSVIKKSTLKTLDPNENFINDAQSNVYDPVLCIGMIRRSLNSLASISSEDL